MRKKESSGLKRNVLLPSSERLIEDLEDITRTLEGRFKKVKKNPDIIKTTKMMNDVAKTIANIKIKVFELLGGREVALISDFLLYMARVYFQKIDPLIDDSKKIEARDKFKEELENLESYYKSRIKLPDQIKKLPFYF